MKAIILAGGLGTRLRPLTLTTPKPLVLIKDKPLLGHHLDSLRNYGIKEILINTHHLPEKMEEFISTYSAENTDVNIKTVFEPELLGSAGTLLANKDFFKGERDILIVYGDVLTDINYQNLINRHLSHNGLITISSYSEEYPEQKGIIETDENDQIKRFVEKPKTGETNSNQANAGIYVARDKIFDYLENNQEMPMDFGYHIFPLLLTSQEKMYVYRMTESVLDIGTPESYAKANI